MPASLVKSPLASLNYERQSSVNCFTMSSDQGERTRVKRAAARIGRPALPPYAHCHFSRLAQDILAGACQPIDQHVNLC